MVAGLRRAKFDQQVLWPEADAANHDFIWCENVIKEHSGSFYRAFSHLGYNEARAVYAIYAFCRTADDAVDEHNDAAELEKLSADLDKFAAGTTIDEPMWRALRITFDRYNLDVKPYKELLTGLAMDLNPEQPQNMDELDHYCYLVAGTVGLMLAPLLAVNPDDDVVRDTSIKLGHAMQLTNILRDVGTDYRLGRTYLPADLMRAHSLEFKDLAGPEMSGSLIELWEKLAKIALGYYDETSRNLQAYKSEAHLPLMLSLNYYRSIIYACRRSGYTLLSKRIYVPDYQKLLLYWKTKIQLLLR